MVSTATVDDYENAVKEAYVRFSKGNVVDNLYNFVIEMLDQKMSFKAQIKRASNGQKNIVFTFQEEDDNLFSEDDYSVQIFLLEDKNISLDISYTDELLWKVTDGSGFVKKLLDVLNAISSKNVGTKTTEYQFFQENLKLKGLEENSELSLSKVVEVVDAFILKFGTAVLDPNIKLNTFYNHFLEYESIRYKFLETLLDSYLKSELNAFKDKDKQKFETELKMLKKKKLERYGKDRNLHFRSQTLKASKIVKKGKKLSDDEFKQYKQSKEDAYNEIIDHMKRQEFWRKMEEAMNKKEFTDQQKKEILDLVKKSKERKQRQERKQKNKKRKRESQNKSESENKSELKTQQVIPKNRQQSLLYDIQDKLKL